MSILTAVRRLVDDERLGAMATCVEGPATGARAVIDAAEGIVAMGRPVLSCGTVQNRHNK